MSGFTVSRLHKYLGSLIKQGHARKPVCISKTTFRHPCEEDGQTILPIYGGSLECILVGDDDGGIKENKDGTEATRMTVVLTGGCDA